LNLTTQNLFGIFARAAGIFLRSLLSMTASVRSLALAGASIEIFPDAQSGSEAAAGWIAAAIDDAIATRGRAIAGLATGGTPIPVYTQLVAFHRAGRLSFAKVSTYNLDEYYPMSPVDPKSYRAYMHEYLFSHVDIPPNQTHLLDGTVPKPFVAEHTAAYDRWIRDEGGLDFQLLGIGRNGHIGFNEPSSLTVDEALALPTRLTELHPVTLSDAARDFDGDLARVPVRALTLGVASILAARSVLVLAFGASKAPAVARSLLGATSAETPGSLLQSIPGKVTWFLDPAAARELG
jgi:glucosamine-6-phosphate deaminase